ncbi:hypothetical protein Syun_014056 [Stephania yunnanensis]|uniref:Uncharacterized protein n=1 Tax=Stephania yunnanensis TaxID=152371 RepID=A0AAP0PBJ1_9MAGN
MSFSLKQMLCLRSPTLDHHQIKLSNKWEDTTDASLRCRQTEYRDEPTSPRVGCMGQMKRKSSNTNNKIINNKAGTNHKYLRLKSMLSGKNSIVGNSDYYHSNRFNKDGNNISHHSFRRKSCVGDVGSRVSNYKKIDRDDSDAMSVADLDPPLPVNEKQRRSSSDEGVSLWRRRCGGGDLKSLQLHKYHQHHHEYH